MHAQLGKSLQGTAADGPAGRVVCPEHGQEHRRVPDRGPGRGRAVARLAVECSKSRLARATLRSSWPGSVLTTSSAWTSASHSSASPRKTPRRRA